MLSEFPVFWALIKTEAQSFMHSDWFYSFLILVGAVMVHRSLLLYARSQGFSVERRHRMHVNARNTLFFVGITLLLMVWSGEIKTYIFSAVAIVSAALIVFKEVFLSIFGAITTGQKIRMGDYIEVDGIQGKVIDRDFLQTTLLVNATFQSQELLIPNMLLMTQRVRRLSKLPSLIMHSFTIGGVPTCELATEAEKVKLIALDVIEVLSPGVTETLKRLDAELAYFDVPDDPIRIHWRLDDPKKIGFTVSFLAQPAAAPRIEHAILKRYLRLKSDRAETVEGATP